MMQGFFKVPAPQVELTSQEMQDFKDNGVTFNADNVGQPVLTPNTRVNAGLLLIDFIGNDSVEIMDLPSGWTIFFLVRELTPTEEAPEEWETLKSIPANFINFMADLVDIDGNTSRPPIAQEPHQFFGWPKRF